MHSALSFASFRKRKPVIGSTGYILIVTLISMLGYVLFPNVYACDLFFIGALYISFFSSKHRAIIIVWMLGLLRGSFSESYCFYPFFFMSAFVLIASVREWLRISHPFTQFLTVLVISFVYRVCEVIFTTEGVLSFWHFWYWSGILLRGLLNASVGIVLFRMFAAVPVRVVVESEKRLF